MNTIRAKKNLGQHFLKDLNIAKKIVDNLKAEESKEVLEIGPGMGILTRFLLNRTDFNLYVIEIDKESVYFLKNNFPNLKNIIHDDFLKFHPEKITTGNFSIIGNFPYNISSQIFFRILEYEQQVEEVVCMLQKEVAERICSKHGNKTYGILSVLLQAYYDIEYLFTVPENVFLPPPKVKSAVVRLKRNQKEYLSLNKKFFFKVVKTAFNQRRKMLRNSLKNIASTIPEEFENLRPEQLSFDQFILLTGYIENHRKTEDYAF